ncbi:MAG TPA: DUF3786 domain-containing protein [Thermoguttaceae bacterium]|nr:DUF3786 domain-containing protein [Thermoguttaceae bacterium]
MNLHSPSPQKNYELATEMGFEALDHQSEEQLQWLGAEREEDVWRLPVFGDTFEVDISARRMTTSAGEPVGATWRILALHYLAISGRPERRVPDTTFADLSAARSYSGIYQGRVIHRLCATAGRDADKLRAAAEALGGHDPAEGDAIPGDAAFDFDEFPRVSLRLIWHAADEEFPPSATLLLPSNIEEYFCSEDIVVLSECLVARLGGRPY